MREGGKGGWRDTQAHEEEHTCTTPTSWYCGGRTRLPGNSRQTTPTETLGMDVRRLLRGEWSEGRRVASTVCVCACVCVCVCVCVCAHMG